MENFKVSESEFYIYVSIFCIAILVLSIGIGYFFVKIKKIKAEQEKLKNEFLKRENERNNFVLESLETICKAYEQDQVEPAEACIRLRMLVDRTINLNNGDFPLIFKMYEELKNFKTHEARNALSLQERSDEDKSRYIVEDNYRDQLKEECKKMLTQLRPQ